MIRDIFSEVKPKYPDIGREALSFSERGAMADFKEVTTFMRMKKKVMENLATIETNFRILENLQKKYEEETGSREETELLTKTNTKNDENSKLLKNSNKYLKEMKSISKRYKFDPNLKNEPEARMMIAISNAIQTKVYKILQKSQLIQVNIKTAVKTKITRQVKTADPQLSEDEVSEMIDNPIAVQEVLQGKIFAGTHVKVRNALQDLNWKYQELGKIEKNMRNLYEMIQDLSMIVKNQTEIINSIEENLKGTKHYIESAYKNLKKGKEEYLKGNERLCCIAVIIIIITLILLWPLLSMLT